MITGLLPPGGSAVGRLRIDHEFLDVVLNQNHQHDAEPQHFNQNEQDAQDDVLNAVPQHLHQNEEDDVVNAVPQHLHLNEQGTEHIFTYYFLSLILY